MQGIHRTGMTTYTILRVIGGLDPDEAHAALGDMRDITYNHIEDWRIEIAEQYFVPHFLGKYD